SGLEVRVPAANWMKGILSAEVELPKYQQRGTLRANLAAAPFQILFDSDSLDLHSLTRLSENAAGLRVESTNWWVGNRVQASARFNRGGFLPDEASLSSERFSIPTSRLRLKGFEDLAGSLSFQWQQN